MTHETPIRVDHVGIAVHSIADAEPFLSLLGCEKLHEEMGKTGDFRWVYYRLGDASRIELVEPVGDEDSFLTAYLDRHGPGLHHVTLEVADIDAVIEALESEGVRVVDRTEFEDWIEAFVSPSNPTGALFQLMEYRESFDDRARTDEELYVDGQRLGRNGSN
jgi:methylmalonyl-CoA/ethylmalonyl-CoA epimerase